MFSSKSESKLQYERFPTSNTTLDCITAVVNNLIKDFEDVILTNIWELALGKPLIRFDTQTFIKCLENKCPIIQLFILDIQNQTINELLKYLDTNSFLNPRAFFIFVHCNIDFYVLSSLSKAYINKAIIINEFGEIQTYVPYKYENINKPYLTPYKIGYCNDDFNFDFSLIGWKPNTWKNSILNVMLRITTPYVTGHNTGIEERLLSLFQDRLKCKMNFTYMEFGTTTLPYFQPKKLLHSHDADIFGGHITILPSDVLDSDITPPYLYDSIRFVTPKPKEMSFWIRSFTIFPDSFWILLVLTIAISSVLTNLLYNISYQDKLFAFIEILVEHPVCLGNTQLLSKRIFFMSWFFFSMVISTLFRNSLIIINATSKKTNAINTLDDVANSKLPIYKTFDLKSYYITREEQEKIQYVSMKQCTNLALCFRNVAFNQNSITIGGADILNNYVIPLYFVENGETLLHIADEMIYGFHIHLLFSKGHPLFEQCSTIIISTLSNGWFVKEYKKMKYELSLKLYQKYPIKSKILSMNELSNTFHLWFFGLLLAFSVLSLEIICYYGLVTFKKKV
ncbi:hypothetical protein ABEB36_008932 [Hypothenemus hampei]|uniref:Uncharacterized protein n=1 Tax=Hypothenemus hampei TaxID=57062 RepID=A0ABD1ERH4_HYPHA